MRTLRYPPAVRRLISILLGSACFAAVTVVLLEGLLALWLAWPALPAAPLAQRLYADETIYPNFDSACARFDPELFYTLRPGTCRFDTREFSTELRINSMGFRDEEASLQAPRVVAVGDSTTMGWGVAEEEAYPALLESRLRIRVLNAGVPSYGTRREMAVLERVDTSALSHLIVQFDTNDHSENKSFFKIGQTISSESDYDRLAAEAVSGARYWPGKHSWLALKMALGESGSGGWLSTRKTAVEAEAFLYALRHGSSVDLSRVHVVVFVIEARAGRYGPAFLSALETALAADPHPGWLGRVTLVDVSDDIQPDVRFRLDPHIGPEGHRRIAERLAAVIAAE